MSPYFIGSPSYQTIGSQTIWLNWIDATTAGTTSYNQFNAHVWNVWQNATHVGTAATYPRMFTGTNAQRIFTDAGLAQLQRVPPTVLTPEQEWQNRQRGIAADNHMRAYGMRKRVAERKAEALLLEHLTDDQAAEYKRLKHFHLIVGDRTYRIRKGMHGNIDVIEDDKVIERLCVYATGGVPEQDNMLAQKLLLEGDEEHLRRVANITRMARVA